MKITLKFEVVQKDGSTKTQFLEFDKKILAETLREMATKGKVIGEFREDGKLVGVYICED